MWAMTLTFFFFVENAVNSIENRFKSRIVKLNLYTVFDITSLCWILIGYFTTRLDIFRRFGWY